MVETPSFFAVGEDFGEEFAGFGAAEEMRLIGGFVVGITRRNHHPFDAEVHHFIEEGADAVGVGAIEERGVGGDAEAAFDGFLNAVGGDVVGAFAADGEVVVVFLAVHVDGEGQIFARCEKVDFFLEQKGVGAEVDVFFAFDEAFDDFFDVGVEEGFAAGDGDHGGAAFIDGIEALLGGEVLFEDVGGVLDFAAAGAGEVASEEGFEHEDKGVVFVSASFLFQDIGGDGPHL